MDDAIYTRTDAIRDGLLVDVSDIAERLGILFPVALSAVLYSDRSISKDLRVENIEHIIQMCFGRKSWISGDKCGAFKLGLLLDHGDCVYPIGIKAIVEPSDDGEGVVATALRGDEVYDLSTSRASFFEV